MCVTFQENTLVTQIQWWHTKKIKKFNRRKKVKGDKNLIVAKKQHRKKVPIKTNNYQIPGKY